MLIGATNGESPQSFTSYWVVKEDSPIRSVKELKGKTVAVNTIGSQMHAFGRIWLKLNGLDPDHDVRFAEIPFPLAETALRQGRVDAIVLVQPFAPVTVSTYTPASDTVGFWSLLVKPFGPVQLYPPLPTPVNCTLNVVQVNVPPAACAPGTVLSSVTPAWSVLLHPVCGFSTVSV